MFISETVRSLCLNVLSVVQSTPLANVHQTILSYNLSDHFFDRTFLMPKCLVCSSIHALELMFTKSFYHTISVIISSTVHSWCLNVLSVVQSTPLVDIHQIILSYDLSDHFCDRTFLMPKCIVCSFNPRLYLMFTKSFYHTISVIISATVHSWCLNVLSVVQSTPLVDIHQNHSIIRSQWSFLRPYILDA